MTNTPKHISIFNFDLLFYEKNENKNWKNNKCNTINLYKTIFQRQKYTAWIIVNAAISATVVSLKNVKGAWVEIWKNREGLLVQQAWTLEGMEKFRDKSLGYTDHGEILAGIVLLKKMVYELK